MKRRWFLGAVAVAFLSSCGAGELATQTTDSLAAPACTGIASAGSCSCDSDCPAGQVCEGCSRTQPKQCVTGCRTDAQCPSGSCQQVYCLRCPCPPQCL